MGDWLGHKMRHATRVMNLRTVSYTKASRMSIRPHIYYGVYNCVCSWSWIRGRAYSVRSDSTGRVGS